MTTEAAEGPEQPALMAERRGQHPQGEAGEAASVTAVKEYAHEEPADVTGSFVLHEPPWYGTVCPVVWEDGGSNPASYPIPFPAHLVRHLRCSEPRAMRGFASRLMFSLPQPNPLFSRISLTARSQNRDFHHKPNGAEKGKKRIGELAAIRQNIAMTNKTPPSS